MKRNNVQAIDDLFDMCQTVTEAGCWLWDGCLHSTGYGVIKIGCKQVKVHRLAAQLAYGVSVEGLFVCHRCDTPSCVNPAHLYLGTHADNTRDMVYRKRYNTRKANEASTKLTPEQLASIVNDDRTQREIACDYGVSQGHISRIKRKARGFICHVSEDGSIPPKWLNYNKDNNNND